MCAEKIRKECSLERQIRCKKVPKEGRGGQCSPNSHPTARPCHSPPPFLPNPIHMYMHPIACLLGDWLAAGGRAWPHTVAVFQRMRHVFENLAEPAIDCTLPGAAPVVRTRFARPQCRGTSTSFFWSPRQPGGGHESPVGVVELRSVTVHIQGTTGLASSQNAAWEGVPNMGCSFVRRVQFGTAKCGPRAPHT